MELAEGILRIDSFLAVTIGVLVLFVGKRLNDKVGLLRELSIPEPVTGGLLFSVLFALVYLGSGYAVEFELRARDVLLVYFFTTIGINARAADLLAGGRPLLILLAITIGFMFAQNLTGVGVASLFDLSGAVGMLGGSVSLIGGHGTTIAWAPSIADGFGIENAMEIGIASATFGLILASLMGGPIARFLITRHQLQPSAIPADPQKHDQEHDQDHQEREIQEQEIQEVGLSAAQREQGINHLDFLGAILAIHIAIILGFFLNEAIAELGLKLPLFVTCLFAGILLTNLIPARLYAAIGVHWPSRTGAVALIADIALGTFLAMSLMSMQLWTLVDLALPIFSILAAQFALAVTVTLFVLFPLMGRDYNAAVVASGFGGVTLGSTPTAMANMAAVTQRYGPSHQAFIIVPLVSAFFIDLTNALIIPFFLTTFA
ncbi:sodium/glutamate symporter [Lamprobacter modestohalophilus]|uniref:Sodium/glutamate symporter n=1 Tax=Lamprobacter modestohalophilus TaxID=1064514 RepID=A0A9X0W7X8_9GAMM|nr:sodium/glutamate symporter [Lamprobacter modestohalophilus]MBK1618609.1 sodium/glutamate symporter [Lamprobacter modestohalophilus]